MSAPASGRKRYLAKATSGRGGSAAAAAAHSSATRSKRAASDDEGNEGKEEDEEDAGDKPQGRKRPKKDLNEDAMADEAAERDRLPAAVQEEIKLRAAYSSANHDHVRAWLADWDAERERARASGLKASDPFETIVTFLIANRRDYPPPEGRCFRLRARAGLRRRRGSRPRSSGETRGEPRPSQGGGGASDSE